MFGDFLKKTRSIYGFRANEMSTELGISASYLSEIENNKKQPSLELLEKYAVIYGIKLSSLIMLKESFENSGKEKLANRVTSKMIAVLVDALSDDSEDANGESD